MSGNCHKSVRCILKDDLYRYGGLSGALGLLRGIMIPGYLYTMVYRYSRNFRRLPPVGGILNVLRYLLGIIFGIQIPPGAAIGNGLYIGHFGYIVVNPRARIGRNCNLNPGVVIGQTNRGIRKGAPTLGDNVWIGAGAVLVGKISIGDRVLIAPNAYVNFDVPPCSLVIGNPGKIISAEDPVAGYIEYPVSSDVSQMPGA